MQEGLRVDRERDRRVPDSDGVCVDDGDQERDALLVRVGICDWLRDTVWLRLDEAVAVPLNVRETLTVRVTDVDN